MYQIITENGYIVSAVKGATEGNITTEQYEEVLKVISNRPQAPEGYCYKLKTDYTWELHELPEVEEEDIEATEEDYIKALNELGVKL